MHNRIVIFEGPDRVFKSTNVKAIADEFAKRNEVVHTLHYHNFKLPKQDNIAYTKRIYYSMYNLVGNSNLNFILDRSALGEYVYGKIYRDYDPSWVFELEKDARSIIEHYDERFYLVILYDEAKNLIDRDDGLSLSTKLLDKEYEIKRFQEAYYRTNIKNKIMINVNGKSREDIAIKLIDFVFPF